ncbi:MAG: DUF401 family protein [Anaerolineae bacterium]
MSALIKLLLVFVGIVMLLSRHWNLAVVLVIASAAIGLLFGYPLSEVARDALRASIDVLTLRLTMIVVLIMVLSELLRRTGGLQGMVEALQALIPGPVAIAALPALVGLLPMVGGAMFSAPMVEEIGARLDADAERKTFINYWFRHVWEYVFPLYPSMMLAAALLEMTTLQLAYATWPLAITAVVGGAVFGLWGIGSDAGEKIEGPTVQHPVRSLVDSIWPIVLVLGLSLVLPLDERLRLIVSLLVTIALLMVVKRVPASELGTILRERIPWKTVAVIFGALIFRRVLDESSAVVAVSRDLTALKVPPALIAFSVPFIAGLLTGLASAAFSIGFPVVAPLLIDGAGSMTSAWAAWLMAGGFLGVMLSPLHLCLSLTRVYFRAEWGPIYRRMAPAVLSVALVAGLLLLVRV